MQRHRRCHLHARRRQKLKSHCFIDSYKGKDAALKHCHAKYVEMVVIFSQLVVTLLACIRVEAGWGTARFNSQTLWEEESMDTGVDNQRLIFCKGDFL
jgi:hypothetical protein